MPNTSWVVQNAMRIKLRRIGISHPASLSTLILEAFIQNGGLLPAREYYGSEHEVKGKKYQQWVEDLRSLGIIEPYKADDLERKGADWIRFKPGKVIRNYINKEKAHQEEMASMRDLRDVESRMDAKKADRDEVQDLKARMNDIAEAVQKLQVASAPPDSIEKQEMRKEITNRLGQLVVKN
jgi:hypothetical protein